MLSHGRIGYYRSRAASEPDPLKAAGVLDLRRKIATVNEMNRTQSVVSEAAFLVGVLLPDRAAEAAPLEELEGLAAAAGAAVAGKLIQRRDAPDAATYLGKGKTDELATRARAADASLIIFDNDLSPGQTRNLERVTGLKVLDRTELILDIFASRAQTHEARLAVELAQLEYSMPRLKRMWTHLSRQAQGGVGLRGPGEKQLEVDRRLAERRIHDLRRELKLIESRRRREVAARHDQQTVSLIGYTNAGKSTLLNAVTGADVVVRDALFVTLDTRTRRWQLPGWGPVLLSDTVGFIRELPHHLVASFRATLEEARQADLLLHVADAGNPAVGQQIAAAYQVLDELGIRQKDTILVLNKIDTLPDRVQLDGLMSRYPTAIPLSARTGQGMAQLTAAVSQVLSKTFWDVDVEMGVENGRLLAYLAAHGEILSKKYRDSRVVVHCRISSNLLSQVQEEGVVIHPRRGENGHPGPAAE
jgi:GTP-binding protein HflX